jgi:signal transduction histidine kinase
MRARVLVVVLITMLPAFALLIFNAADERERALALTREQALSTVRLVSSQQTQLIEATEQIMRLIAQAPALAVPDECSAFLERVYSGAAGYRGFSVADRNGDVYCMAPTRPITQTLNTAHRSYFQKVLETEHFAIGDFQIGQVSGEPNISFGYPVRDAAGALTGVIWTAWSIERINELAATWRLPEGTVVTVMDSEGTLVTRYPSWQDWVGKSYSDSLLFRRMTEQPEGTERLPGLDGVPRWFAFSRVSALNFDTGQETTSASFLYIAAGFSDESFLRSVNNRLTVNLVTLGLILVLGLVMAYGLIEWMIGQRARLVSETTRELQRGNWSARTGMTGDEGELGEVGRTVDEMADALQERDRALQTMNAELEERVGFRTAELAAANAQLLASQDQLRRLSRDLLDVAEEERIRLANDVSDEIGQGLTGIKMDVVLAQRHLAEGKAPDATGHLTAAVRNLNALIESARHIAGYLRPSVLDDFGLTAAVEGQLAEFERQTGAATRLSADVDEGRLSKSVSTAAFRILQEALRNVAQHARATKVDVTVHTADSQLVLEVRDNGRGFAAAELTKPQAIGVLGMRERALQLGGTLEIAGAPGQGARLTLMLPVVSRESMGTVAHD